MKILRDKEIAPLYMGPDSTLSVSWNGEQVLTQKITKPITANRVLIFEIQDELGFKTGIGAIVGESQ